MITRDEYINEFKRCFPDFQDSHGIIHLDMAILFPYRNSEAVTFGFGLVNDDVLTIEDAEFDDYIYEDFTLNHRYPNKNYLTASRKNGRKICKTGYPIFGEIDELNRYRMLLLKMGIGTEYLYFGFGLDFHITKENPVVSLKCRIHNFEDTSDLSEFGIDFTSHKPDLDYEGGKGYRAWQYYYQVGQNVFGEEWFEETHAKERCINLQHFAGDENSCAVAFAPKIKLYEQPKECMWL